MFPGLGKHRGRQQSDGRVPIRGVGQNPLRAGRGDASDGNLAVPQREAIARQREMIVQALPGLKLEEFGDRLALATDIPSPRTGSATGAAVGEKQFRRAGPDGRGFRGNPFRAQDRPFGFVQGQNRELEPGGIERRIVDFIMQGTGLIARDDLVEVLQFVPRAVMQPSRRLPPRPGKYRENSGRSPPSMRKPLLAE